MFRVQIGRFDAVNDGVIKVGPPLIGILFVPSGPEITVSGKGKEKVEAKEHQKRNALPHTRPSWIHEVILSKGPPRQETFTISITSQKFSEFFGDFQDHKLGTVLFCY